MRIAILHFHLRGGGVTRIIEMACEALAKQGCDVLVISGEPAPKGCRVPPGQVAVAPSLRYDGEAVLADDLQAEVEAAELRHWGARADVVHLHNHALGKNFALPIVATRWVRAGRCVLFQIHDFAEDGRPGNYRELLRQLGGTAGLNEQLYPVAPQTSYRVLSTHDLRRFQEAGLEADCEVLPNPVSLPACGESFAASELGAEYLTVYPARAIRRKNIGETILWAAKAQKGEKVVITLAPVGLADQERHADWMAFANEMGLPVVFDAQRLLRRPTEDFILSADRCLTTSVGEGFGMAFVEPWLADCEVVGRDLPGVTQDMRRSGLALNGLYPRLDVSVSSELAREITGVVEERVRGMLEAYERPFDPVRVEQALQSMFRDGKVDFGRVNEAQQRVILRNIDPDSLPPLYETSQEERAGNQDVLRREYSLENYGDRLINAYRRLVEAAPEPPVFLDSARLLSACLCFEDFFVLRS